MDQTGIIPDSCTGAENWPPLLLLMLLFKVNGSQTSVARGDPKLSDGATRRQTGRCGSSGRFQVDALKHCSSIDDVLRQRSERSAGGGASAQVQDVEKGSETIRKVDCCNGQKCCPLLAVCGAVAGLT